MDLLNLHGPEFLVAYIVLLCVMVPGAFLLRLLLRGPRYDPPIKMPEFEPLEMAYLAGGADGAVNAAIAALVQQETLSVRATTREVTAVAALPPDASLLERAVHA